MANIKAYTEYEMFKMMNAEEDKRYEKMAEAEFEYERGLEEIHRLQEEIEIERQRTDTFNYLLQHANSPSELYLALVSVGQNPSSMQEVTELYKQLNNR